MEDIPGEEVPIPNVSGVDMQMFIRFAEKDVELGERGSTGARAQEEMWNEFKAVEFGTLPNERIFSLIVAANYLNYKEMLTYLCQVIANKIKGKSPEEIRAEFNIKNDFTPEEEEEIRRENAWAFE